MEESTLNPKTQATGRSTKQINLPTVVMFIEQFTVQGEGVMTSGSKKKMGGSR
jgi:hypothetical protein